MIWPHKKGCRKSEEEKFVLLLASLETGVTVQKCDALTNYYKIRYL